MSNAELGPYLRSIGCGVAADGLLVDSDRDGDGIADVDE